MVEILPPGGGGGGGADLTLAYSSDIVPTALTTSSNPAFIVPLTKDNLGTPDRLVGVGFLTVSTAKIISFSRAGGTWYHDPDVDVLDSSVTIGMAANNIARVHGFAIQDPGTATGAYAFIQTSDATANPDTFILRSTLLPDGSHSLASFAAVTIAGANAPPSVDAGGHLTVPVSNTRAITFFQDDMYFADITGTGPFTFTYADPPVLAIAAEVNVSSALTRYYSASVIGTQVILLRAGSSQPSETASTSAAAWEFTTAGVLVKTLNPFVTGAMSARQDGDSYGHSAVFAHEGVFKLLAPFASQDGGRPVAYIISPFPIDDF
jgi:hypothetical protein